MEGVKDFPKFVKKIFYEHDLSKLNLNINPTQTKILMYIDQYGEKSMSKLSQEVGLEKSSFTRSVDLLINHGFIKKKYSTLDRRIINISFAAKGKKAVKLIKADWNKYFESLISIFSAEEKKEFTEAIRIVSKYINRIIE